MKQFVAVSAQFHVDVVDVLGIARFQRDVDEAVADVGVAFLALVGDVEDVRAGAGNDLE